MLHIFRMFIPERKDQIMNIPWKLKGLSCMTLVFAVLVAAGCEDKADAPYSQSPPVTSDPIQHTVVIEEPITPEPTFTPTPTPSATPSGDEHVAQVSSNNKDTKTAAETPKQTSKPKVPESDRYQQEKPTLMGLQLGTSSKIVLNRFGEATTQFVMDEDADAITVHEYTDFSVGFNVKNELEFVDVHTTEIDPGLGGLRLGQSSEDAIRILGMPDSNTTYVLSYKAQGTLLKLDIDPKTDTIQSIKLFANR
jgi:hypothetical protein